MCDFLFQFFKSDLYKSEITETFWVALYKPFLPFTQYRIIQNVDFDI